MRIVLIGFMGSGKSTLSSLLADSLALPLIELDEEILKLSRSDSINEIFKNDGEERFRELEHQAAANLSTTENCIVSTGGGVVKTEDTMKLLLKGNSTCIFLRTKFSTIEERLLGDSTRPLFANKEAAKELFHSRRALYSHYADIICDTDESSPEKLLQVLLAFLNARYPAVLPKRSQLICAIAGNPVSGSLSPLIHNSGYRALDIKDAFYGAVKVSEAQIAPALDTVKRGVITGMSCTMPLKISLLSYLEEVDPVVKQIGAVNTVYLRSGLLYGTNTDWNGIISPLESLGPLRGKRVGILGSGGASRAAAFGVKTRGAHPIIFGRDPAKVGTLAEELGVEGHPLSSIPQLRSCDIIINGTSVGMAPHHEDSPLPQEALSSRPIVFDTIYTPRETKLISLARSVGCTVIYGTEMLLYQALEQFRLFTNREAPELAMRKALEEAFS